MKEPVKTSAPAPAPAPARTSAAVDAEGAAKRLRAFEDEHFGKDCYRHEGKVERGIGSHYARLSDDKKAKHAALEHAMSAHLKVALAKDTLAAAEAEAAEAEAAANAQ